MEKPLLVIGLGGFGKWVVTAFKTRILDTYGEKPPGIDWVSFDLTAEETPLPKYTRFESGKLKEETLDFTRSSDEFIRLGGDYANVVQRIRDGDIDPRFSGRMSIEDANLFVLAQDRDVPAGERRHASMIQFCFEFEKIKRTIRNKLKSNSFVFLVSSWAGGTGTGCFIDFLLLLRQLLVAEGGTIISIVLLPHGFSRVKESEDMDPLFANCYAAFREFHRLFYNYGNVKVQFSLTDPDFEVVSKPRGVDVISDLVYLVDGSKIGGLPGDRIEYYRGTVPAIANFIQNSFLSYNQEKVDAKARTEASFDQGKEHSKQNFLKKEVQEYPYNSFTYSSFGSYRLIFDSKAVKTEFAQRIALKIFGQEKFLAPSWIAGNDLSFTVKKYLQEQGTLFDKTIIHECLHKGPEQLKSFATFRSLKSKLEDVIKFPDFNLGNIKQKGTVEDLNSTINRKEEINRGEISERYTGSRRSSFYSVRNYYLGYYTDNFKESIQKRVLDILNKDLNTDEYGKGSLRTAENFLREIKKWYILFLKGIPEEGRPAEFAELCEAADDQEGTYVEQKGKTEEYYNDNRNKGKRISFPKKKYLELRVRLNEIEIRDLIRILIIEIATRNLEYLEKLHEKIQIWLNTFRECNGTLDKALNDLLEVRTAKSSIMCEEYLTSSKDQIEGKLFDLVSDPDYWDEVNSDDGSKLNPFEIRLKEIIHKVPKNKWADILKGFKWKFNLPDPKGQIPAPRHDEGDLICGVDADSGLPDFPGESELDAEYIRTWNYKLVEYYLSQKKLNLLDEISAFEVLMLKDEKPEEILDSLQKKSQVMLNIASTTEKNLVDTGFANFKPESRYTILADFGSSKEVQKALNFWIDTFMKKITGSPGGTNISVADERSKPQEIVIVNHNFCLTASAAVNLYSNRSVYLNRLGKNMPPPLHIFLGEKEAYKCEAYIKEEFHTAYEELHPQVVTILEEQELLKTILWANILDLIKKDEAKRTNIKSYYFELDDSKFILFEGEEWPLYSDLLYDLIYVPAHRENQVKAMISSLSHLVDEEMKNITDLHKIKEEKIKEFKDMVNKNDFPRKEKDLFKAWMFILNK